MRKKVVLDIGSYKTKLMFGHYTNGFVVAERTACIDSPEGIIQNGLLNVDIATQTISDLLEMLELRSTNMAGVSIVESSTVISRSLTLPYLTPEDLNNMVHMEIGRLFADVLQNYLIDYTCLEIFDNPDIGGKQASVMVFAMPDNVYESYYNTFENLHISQNILDIMPNSTGRILRSRIFINDVLCSQEETIALVDMGHSSTSVLISSNGNLAFTRTLNKGGNLITQSIMDKLNISFDMADKMKIENADILSTAPTTLNDCVSSMTDDIVSEIQRVFRYFLSSQSTGTVIDKVYIYGGTSRIQNLAKYMSNELSLNVSTIQTMNFLNLKQDLPLDCFSADFLNTAGALMRI